MRKNKRKTKSPAPVAKKRNTQPGQHRVPDADSNDPLHRLPGSVQHQIGHLLSLRDQNNYAATSWLGRDVMARFHRSRDYIRPGEVPRPLTRVSDKKTRYEKKAWRDSNLRQDPSPYRNAIIDGAEPYKPGHLSLAYAIEPPARGQQDNADYLKAITEGSKKLAGVPSCHPGAAQVVDQLGRGVISSFGNLTPKPSGEKREAASGEKVDESPTNPMQADGTGSRTPAHEALLETFRQVEKGELPPQVVKYSHQNHSISLFVHAGGVEPMEQWAGARETDRDSGNGAVRGALHESLMDGIPVVPFAKAREAAAALGDPDQDKREVGLNTFSHASLSGFENGEWKAVDGAAKYVVEKPFSKLFIGMDRRDALSPDQIRARVWQKVGLTNDDLNLAMSSEKLRSLRASIRSAKSLE